MTDRPRRKLRHVCTPHMAAVVGQTAVQEAACHDHLHTISIIGDTVG